MPERMIVSGDGGGNMFRGGPNAMYQTVRCLHSSITHVSDHFHTDETLSSTSGMLVSSQEIQQRADKARLDIDILEQPEEGYLPPQTLFNTASTSRGTITNTSGYQYCCSTRIDYDDDEGLLLHGKTNTLISGSQAESSVKSTSGVKSVQLA